MKKKILRNKPFKNARGQYNFDLNKNLSVYPYTDDKFLNKDLYSVNIGNDVNEAILREPYTINVTNDSYFRIESLIIENAKVSHYLNHVSFQIYVMDRGSLGLDPYNTSYGTIISKLQSSNKIYTKSYGEKPPGWGPGQILSNVNIFEKLFTQNLSFTPFEGSTTETYNEAAWLASSIQTPNPDQNTSEIYIMVQTGGDAHRFWGTDHRESRLHIFTIKTADLLNSSKAIEFNFTYGDATKYRGGGGSGGAEAPAFKVDELKIVAYRGNPTMDELTPNLQPYSGDLNFSNYISNDDYSGFIEARPNRVIDWSSTKIPYTVNIDFDFYPYSNVTVVDDLDIQSYYTETDDRFKASSPITVDFSLGIGNYGTGEITNYLPGNVISHNYPYENLIPGFGELQNMIKFKYFVLDWNDGNNNLIDWDSVFRNWPKNVDEFLDKRQNNLYNLSELYYPESILNNIMLNNWINKLNLVGDIIPTSPYPSQYTPTDPNGGGGTRDASESCVICSLEDTEYMGELETPYDTPNEYKYLNDVRPNTTYSAFVSYGRTYIFETCGGDEASPNSNFDTCLVLYDQYGNKLSWATDNFVGDMANTCSQIIWTNDLDYWVDTVWIAIYDSQNPDGVCSDNIDSSKVTSFEYLAEECPPENDGGLRVEDCRYNGNCVPVRYLGDGSFCDGTDAPYGHDLSCYDSDGGDCTCEESGLYNCPDGSCAEDLTQCPGYDPNTYEWITDSPLQHTYSTPGIKTIKSVIFSYLEDADGVRFQPLRWKFVTTRIYLDNAKVLVEDFSDIGGADFVTLPWPHTTPIISGISKNSQYMNSLNNVLSSGKISEVDVIDSSILFKARENDELGDYVGDMDFEQTRVFNQPYSMAELLMVDDHITTTKLNSYTDNTYWDFGDDSCVECNTFPMESCVGLIFINDSMDQDTTIKQSCILELNSQELEGDIIRDSAGKGNKGILIGDYKIDKPSKDVPIRRRTEPKVSETDSENGAI